MLWTSDRTICFAVEKHHQNFQSFVMTWACQSNKNNLNETTIIATTPTKKWKEKLMKRKKDGSWWKRWWKIPLNSDNWKDKIKCIQLCLFQRHGHIFELLRYSHFKFHTPNSQVFVSRWKFLFFNFVKHFWLYEKVKVELITFSSPWAT